MTIADRRCQYPKVEPSRENPGGDCGAAGARWASPLGRTGRYLALCDGCAEHAPSPSSLVPIEQVEQD